MGGREGGKERRCTINVCVCVRVCVRARACVNLILLSCFFFRESVFSLKIPSPSIHPSSYFFSPVMSTRSLHFFPFSIQYPFLSFLVDKRTNKKRGQTQTKKENERVGRRGHKIGGRQRKQSRETDRH